MKIEYDWLIVTADEVVAFKKRFPTVIDSPLTYTLKGGATVFNAAKIKHLLTDEERLKLRLLEDFIQFIQI